jgi:hypothetical protein
MLLAEVNQLKKIVLLELLNVAGSILLLKLHRDVIVELPYEIIAE